MRLSTLLDQEAGPKNVEEVITALVYSHLCSLMYGPCRGEGESLAIAIEFPVGGYFRFSFNRIIFNFL